MPRHNDDSARAIERQDLGNKAESTLRPLPLVDAKIHNNHSRGVKAKKLQCADNARCRGHLQRSYTGRQRSSQALEELTIVVDQ